MENQTDEQLVKAYLKGNEQALEVLIQRYLSYLYNFAFKYTHTESAAEDVVQDSLVVAWTRLARLSDPQSFGPWVSRIVFRRCLRASRRQRGRVVDRLDGDADQSLQGGGGAAGYRGLGELVVYGGYRGVPAVLDEAGAVR